jgi:hypothetical protein
VTETVVTTCKNMEQATLPVDPASGLPAILQGDEVPGFPVRTARSSVDLGGSRTEILVSRCGWRRARKQRACLTCSGCTAAFPLSIRYSDKLLVIATQLPTVGTILHVRFGRAQRAYAMRGGHTSETESSIICNSLGPAASDAAQPPLSRGMAFTPDDEDGLEDGDGRPRGTASTEVEVPIVLLGKRDDPLLLGLARALATRLRMMASAESTGTAGASGMNMLPPSLMLCAGLDPLCVDSDNAKNVLLPVLERAAKAVLVNK